jgi:DNA-binding IclR family transcriptional regulator
MNDTVKSASRVLDILELFASSERPLALRDVAAILGLPKSSAHMLLGTLERRGYLVRAASGGYALPRAPAEPGGWVGGVAGQIFRAAQPVLERLRGQIRETVVLGMPTPGLDIRIVSHRVSPQAIRYDISDVPVIPGYCTAMGHVILANLPDEQVRAYLEATELQPLTRMTLTDPQAIFARLRQSKARGYALNIDERFEGAGGAAVAIRDLAGRPHAAINIVTVTPRFRARQHEIVAALTEAGRELEAAVFGGVFGGTGGGSSASQTVGA